MLRSKLFRPTLIIIHYFEAKLDTAKVNAITLQVQ